MTIFGTGLLKENATSCIPCTPQEEMHIVTELTKGAESNLNEGNLYYVISNSWFAKWQKYVGYGVKEPITTNYMDIVPSGCEAKPGPINNSDIILANGSYESDKFELQRSLVEGHDYVLVPQVVWKKLHSWYNGGPELPRKMISQGHFHINYIVEVYPLCLTLIDSRDNSNSVIRLSRKASLLELYDKVSEVKRISKEKVRIWDFFNNYKQSLLTSSNQTLEQCNLQMDQNIFMEVNEEGNWLPSYENGSRDSELAIIPVEPLRSSLTIAGGPTASNGCSTAACSSNTFQENRTLAPLFTEVDDVITAMKKGDKGGLAGLQNLGNTCFMNSAIQCLVHTPPLLSYFLKDYSEEINRHNPLGMHGELAVAFGELLRRLWSSGRMSIAPRVFKGKLARFAPQFSGYNQHDSQELLAFLLDGLHEDLNRVKQKPYIEIKDYDGRPDEEVAVECWRNHKARNDSIIVDMCQGVYKSTLVCPTCGKISITFDPFMYLSLPLPSTLTRSMTVTVIYSDGSALPMPYTVSVPKHGCCRDLTLALAAACCLASQEDLLLAEIFNNNIYRYFENPLDPISSVKDDEHIVAYRLPKIVLREGVTKIELVHRYAGGEKKFFGTPLVTFIRIPQTGSDVLGAVRMMLSPLRRARFRSPVRENGKNEEEETEEGCSSGREGEDGRGREVELTVETEEKGGVNLRILEETAVRPCRIMKVGVVWGRREEEIYDSDYLKDLPEVHKNGFPAKKTRQEVISLFSCVDAFLKEEPLGPDDMWYCPGCREHRQARKKLDLWRLPDILVFHLKRFSYSRYMKNKLDTFVNFPISMLDLTNYVKSSGSGSHVYELYAVSNHYGGLGGGHYSAYAKLVDGENQWYHFDDTHVSAVGEEGDVRTSAAYVLFYQRVGRTGGGDEDVDME